MLFGYEEENEFIEHIELTKNKIIPVICSYDTMGNCTPIYFRYFSNTGESIAVKIDSVEYCDKNSIFGYRYSCRITINQIRMQIFLFYHTQTQTWSLKI